MNLVKLCLECLDFRLGPLFELFQQPPAVVLENEKRLPEILSIKHIESLMEMPDETRGIVHIQKSSNTLSDHTSQ